MSEMEESSASLFRSTKRRKIVQRRHFDDEESKVKVNEFPTHAGNDHEPSDTPALASRLKQRNHLPRRHGIAFAAHENQPKSSNESVELPMVVVASAAEEGPPQIDRFMKPTGRVGIVEDKHLAAYVDSKLAELRSASSESDTGLNKAERTTHEAQGLLRGSEDPAIISEQAEPEGRTQPTFSTTSGMSQPVGKVAPLHAKQPRRRRRAHVDDPTSKARAAMVDEIMGETPMPIYDRTPSTRYAGLTNRLAAGATARDEGGDAEADSADVDNDEAVAEAFKAEFLAHLNERNRRRQEAAASSSSSSRNAMPSQGVAPKLGGSRAQRQKMRAAAAAGDTKGAGAVQK